MLTRWDPFREMMNLRRTVDRLFDNTVGAQGEEWAQPATWGLSLDVIENKDDFVVKLLSQASTRMTSISATPTTP